VGCFGERVSTHREGCPSWWGKKRGKPQVWFGNGGLVRGVNKSQKQKKPVGGGGRRGKILFVKPIQIEKKVLKKTGGGEGPVGPLERIW